MNRPKRRKLKDNPYELICENNNYFIKFKDSNNNMQTIQVSNEIFDTFNHFELKDLKMLNEYDRHIEHSEVYEETLYKRANILSESIDEKIERKILIDNVKEQIDKLPEIQKRRLKKYYFDNKTYEQIAIEESCSKVAVKYSVDIAIKKISENFKN